MTRNGYDSSAVIAQTRPMNTRLFSIVAGEVAAYDEISEEVRYNFDVILGWTGGPKTVTVDGVTVKHETIRGKDVADWLTKGTKKANLYLVSGSYISRP